jgi:hypothetical protein
LVELLSETEGLLAVAEELEVGEGGVGLTVDGLAAAAALLGQACHVAVLAAENDSGAGNPIEGC